MADQTVTLVLDAAQYYREIGKITGETDKFKGSTDRTGESLDGLRLKTEGRVAANIGAIARSFTSGGSAADIFAGAVTRVGESFRGSLLFAGAAALGVGLYEAIVKPIEAIIQLEEEIHKLKLQSTIGKDFLSSDQIKQNVSDTGAKIKTLQADLIALQQGKGKLGPIDFMGSETRAFFESEDQRRIAELRGTAANDVLSLTSKQNDLNRAEQESLDTNQELLEVDKARIDHNEKLGALGELIKNADLQDTEAARQLLAVENDRYIIASKTLAKKQGMAFADHAGIPQKDVPREIAEFQQSITRKADLAPLLLNQAAQAEDLSRAQAQQGDLAESGRLHIIAQEQLDKANELIRGKAFLESEGRRVGGILGDAGSQVKPGFNQIADKLQTLGNLTFKGLMDVSELTFEGLKILNGLTLSIQ